MDLAIIPSARVDATVLRPSLHGIVSIGADGRVLGLNLAAQRMFGRVALGQRALAGHGETVGEARALMLRRAGEAGVSLLLRGGEVSPPAGRGLLVAEGMGCLLMVALCGDRGAIVGMLAVAAADPHAIGPDGEGFAQSIANVTGQQLRRLRSLGLERAQGEPFASPPAGDAALELARSRAVWSALLKATRPARAPQPGGATVAPAPAGAPAARARGATLSLGQAAHALRISTTTARRWADDGRLGATRTAGGHRRFAAAEVRRLLADLGRPSIAPASAPRRPLPGLADLVAEHGAALSNLSWRRLYGDLRAGFFLDPEGSAAAGHWTGALSSAAATGDYETLHEATSALMRSAERGGASLLERHLALERFGETALRALVRRSCPREEIAAVRRLFASLGQHQLADAG